MDIKAVQDIFIKILRSSLNGTELDTSVKEQLTPEILSVLFTLSKHHDVAHIISSVLYKSNIQIEKELQSKFNKEEILSVYRYEQMKYAYEEICNVFEENKIAYIPLKGSIIRPYYPTESMRTSCDIDILIHEEELDKAKKALMKRGYKCGERNYHDVSLYSSNNIHLELHFNIQENIDALDVVLKNAWQYAVVEKGYRYQFSEEFFLFHMFAHMSYHFLSGGCGVRSLMDIWIMEHKMGIGYPCAKELLESAGIYKFAEEISKLVNSCFLGTPKEDFTEQLLFYILNGGVYGTSSNKVAAQKGKSKSTFVYAWRRLFLPYKTMKERYPVLKKIPVLLPVFWGVRFFKMLFGDGRKRSVKELKAANDISNDKVDAVTQMRNFLGL